MTNSSLFETQKNLLDYLPPNFQLYDAGDLKEHGDVYLRIPKTGSTTIVDLIGGTGRQLTTLTGEDINIFTVVREPLARAISMYQECKRSNHRKTRTLTEWLDKVEEEGFYNNHASEQMKYIETIKQVFENVTLIAMDDILKNVSQRLNASTEEIEVMPWEEDTIRILWARDFKMWDYVTADYSE